MEKIIIFSLILLLNFSLSSAAPLEKPSQEALQQLIKKMIFKSKTTIFTGIERYAYPHNMRCKNIKVEKIDILKIGRASSNYYERSGNYINSAFKVKFFIKGSCDLNHAYRINSAEYNKYTYLLEEANRHHGKKPTPVMPMDLNGTVPFRDDIPFEVDILTDDYGDWYASEYPNAFNKQDRCLSDKTTKYLKQRFYQTNKSSIEKWEQAQIAEKNRLSNEAESGKNLIKYDRLFTQEVKSLLDAQPKRIREFVFSNYWKLARQESDNTTHRFRKSRQFLKEVIKQMKLQK